MSTDSIEAELIARICQSDIAAFESLYRRYYHRLFRFAYRVTRRIDLIEEIINDTMYVVWKKSTFFQTTARPSTWIFGIAYKQCLKTIAKHEPIEHIELDDAAELIPGIQDKGLQDLEIEDWITAAFRILPADQRTVLELVYHQDLHYSEIARIMDCPENTVKTRMFNARKKIKAMFPDFHDVPKSFYSDETL
ncbi:MAG: RNA polymerase sigma factor [Gammaproteobacteria bacterium]